MDVRYCFETESFNELINFSFDEVREVFNYNEHFVADADGEQFIAEAAQVKNWYAEELDKIEQYGQFEYSKIINSGVAPLESDDPQYKIKNLENQTKRKLIKLISKYFNKEVYQISREELFGKEVFKEETQEMLHEMLVVLNVNKYRIYQLLSIIGYYQRRKGYFLSKSDFFNICCNYSNQVYFINKNLGMEHRFVNIFIGSSRIKGQRQKKSGSVDANIENVVAEGFQNSKFIDVDKTSLLMLVQPFLKHNTKELKRIIEIMDKNLSKRKDEDRWEKTLNEVGEFIYYCELKGIMKRL